MLKKIFIFFVFSTISISAYDISDQNRQQIYQELETAKTLINHHQNEFEIEISDSIKALIDSTETSIQKDDNWRKIFHTGCQMMIMFCGEIKNQLRIWTKTDPKFNDEVSEKIYGCFFRCLNLSGGKPKGEPKSMKFSISKLYKKHFEQSFCKFRDRWNNEVDDGCYDTYRKYLWQHQQSCAALALEYKFEADLILEKVPYFSGRDLIKGLVGGACQSCLVNTISTKAIVIASAAVYVFTERCMEGFYYYNDNIEEYSDKLHKAKSYKIEANACEEWLWTH